MTMLLTTCKSAKACKVSTCTVHLNVQSAGTGRDSQVCTSYFILTAPAPARVESFNEKSS